VLATFVENEGRSSGGAGGARGVDRHAHLLFMLFLKKFLIRGLTMGPQGVAGAERVWDNGKGEEAAVKPEAALQGIRILGFSRYMQGPHCSQMLEILART